LTPAPSFAGAQGVSHSEDRLSATEVNDSIAHNLPLRDEVKFWERFGLCASALFCGTKQVTPCASNRRLQLGQSGHEDIDVARLNFWIVLVLRSARSAKTSWLSLARTRSRRTLLPKFPQLSFLCCCS